MAFQLHAVPKPPKGSMFMARKTKKAAIKSFEESEKRAVRIRDGHKCRWPGCRNGKDIRTEVAHLNDKGIGGDHSARSTRDQMMLLCFLCHQGPNSLHAKTRHIEPLTDRGTDGVCAFYELNPETGKADHIATEKAIGITEARS